MDIETETYFLGIADSVVLVLHCCFLFLVLVCVMCFWSITTAKGRTMVDVRIGSRRG